MQNPISSRSEWRIDLPGEIRRWRYSCGRQCLVIIAPHKEIGEFWIERYLREIAEGLPVNITEIEFEADGWLKAFRINRVAPGW